MTEEQRRKVRKLDKASVVSFLVKKLFQEWSHLVDDMPEVDIRVVDRTPEIESYEDRSPYALKILTSDGSDGADRFEQLMHVRQEYINEQYKRDGWIVMCCCKPSTYYGQSHYRGLRIIGE